MKSSRAEEYIGSVGKLWGQEISGPILAAISIVLAVFVPFVSDTPTATTILRAGAWTTGAVAVLLIFVAQYKVWNKERDDRELEQAKNQRPELKGSAFGFKVSGHLGHGHDQGHWSARAEFEFRLDLCNHRDVRTNITAIKLDGSLVYPVVEFAPCFIIPETLFGSPPDIQLEYGIWKQFRVKSDATVDGLHLVEVKEIDLERLKISVVDGFGDSHLIQPKAGEKLSFSRT